MVELEEREATEAVAEKEAAETAAHAALMQEANLEVPTCLLACLFLFSGLQLLVHFYQARKPSRPPDGPEVHRNNGLICSMYLSCPP